MLRWRSLQWWEGEKPSRRARERSMHTDTMRLWIQKGKPCQGSDTRLDDSRTQPPSLDPFQP